MPITIVRCSMPRCGAPATYKIAAPWRDGIFTELKTYGHACTEHLGSIFRDAEERRASYRPAPGEIVGSIGIYRFEHGWLDWQLQRLADLEDNYRSWGSGSEGV
jgi:hypothetical protein